MTRRRNWFVCLAMLGVFVAGAVTGVLATGAYIHHSLRSLHGDGPDGIHHLGVRWLDWKLDLSPEQELAIEQVIEDVHIELFKFKSAHNEELEAVVTGGLERVDRTLTSEQRAKWSPIRARIAQHAAVTYDDVQRGHSPAVNGE